MAFYDYDDSPRYSTGRRYESNTSRSRAYYDDLKYSSSAPDPYGYHAYDYLYSDHLPPRTSSYRSQRRRKPKWPPSPTVEDAVASLARELDSAALLLIKGDNEVPMRGTVDQEPIMVEVEEAMAALNPERRFVLVPGNDDDDDDDAAATADKSSDRVAGRKSRRDAVDRHKGPPLQTDLKEPPVFTRRAPSPYAYSRPDASRKERLSGDSYSYLSPDAGPTSSPAIPGYPEKFGDRLGDVRKLKPTRGQAESLLSPDSVRNNGTFDDSDLDGEDSANLRTRRKPARYSFSPADLKKEDLRTSLHDSEPERDREPVPSPRSSSYSFSAGELKKDDLRPSWRDTEPDRYRNGDRASSPRAAAPPSPKPSTPPSATTRSTPKSTGSPSAATPSSSTQFFHHDLPWARPTPSRQGTLETLYGSVPSQRGSSRASSTPPSPLPKEPKLPPSPPHSPGFGSRDSTTPKARAEPRSKPPSRVASRTSSPLAVSVNPHSPPSPRPDANDRPERVFTFPPITALKDGSRPSSRHSRYDTILEDPGLYLDKPRIDVQSPSPARPPQRPATTLPYPDDDMQQLMPSEERFQYNHDSPLSPTSAGFGYGRDPAPSVPMSVPNHMREEASTSRVPLRRTLSETSAQTETVAGPFSSRDSRSRMSVDIEPPSLTKPLPACPRSNPSSKYDDWYTLEGYPSFGICPDCLNGIVGRTVFRSQFFRARPLDREQRKKCDFSSPWFRLAWLLTIQQQRTDLSLIETLASIAGDDIPCPDTAEAVRIWYGIRDKHGNFVSNFYICQNDARFVEALLPSLRGVLTRIDTNPNIKRACSLRTSSHRFSQYLDTLLDIDSASQQARRAPDLNPFIELARSHAYRSECQRDTLLTDGLWHTIPGLPDFTVCEECFDAAVWPAIQAGSKVADRVSRAIASVPPPDQDTARLGQSCQLYSPRMRRVWLRVVRDDDFAYLARKVRERRAVECELQTRHRALRRLLEEQKAVEGQYGSAGGFYGSGAVDEGRIRDELETIQREWREWE